MAEAGSYSEARTGNWLWALLVGAILLVMELILFAALVPATWSERVRATELAWLQHGLGPSTAKAVVERAEQWYAALFVEPGLVETSYRITLPNDEDVQRAGALSPLATLPLWTWVAGRLEVIWAAFHQALQRLAMLAAWWPFLLLLLAAAWGDGWVRRRIRQAGFAYASPPRACLRPAWDCCDRDRAGSGAVSAGAAAGARRPRRCGADRTLGGRDRGQCAEALVIIGSDQAPPVTPRHPPPPAGRGYRCGDCLPAGRRDASSRPPHWPASAWPAGRPRPGCRDRATRHGPPARG